MVRLAISPNISALKSNEHVVGQRVTNREAFLAIMVSFVTDAIPTAEFDDQDDFCTIKLPSDILPFVSSGVGRRSNDTDHYVARKHCGRVGLYLKREFSLSPEECTVQVLPVERYLAECKEYEETPLSDAAFEGVTHVVVALRVQAGPQRNRLQQPHDLVRALANMVGKPDHKQVNYLLNTAWNVDNYWRTFSEVSD